MIIILIKLIYTSNWSKDRSIRRVLETSNLVLINRVLV